MSENRFNDCDTIEDVLAGIRESVGKGWIIDRDIDADALARIRELTAVSGEARERARVEMAQMLNDAANGRMAAGFQIVDDSLDRIIDALGYTPAPPEESPECPCPPGDCCVSQTASPPVVELAPDELRTLASVVETYEHLHTQLTNIAGIDHVPPYLDVFIDEGQSVRVVCDENGCWVLRIGGDQ